MHPPSSAVLALVAIFASAGSRPASAQPPRLVHTFDNSADSGVRFSKDGKHLILYSGIDGVRVYDPDGWKKLRTFGLEVGERPIVSAEFHPDGKTVATGNFFNHVHLWDVATGKSAGTWPAPPKDSTGAVVSALNFSPDGKVLVVNGRYLCDPATGKLIRTLGQGRQPRYSPDGKYLAGIVDGAVAEIWDVATGKSAGQVLHGRAGQLQGVAFRPDGKALATSGSDLAVRLWDVPGLRPIATFEPIGLRDGSVKGAGPLAFSPDGKTLAVGDGDGHVHLWDVAAGREVGVWRAYYLPVYTLVWSPDGATLVTAGRGGAKVWDTAKFKKPQ